MNESILDDELVKKYFGCPCIWHESHHHQSHIAFNVLRAMEEPIKKGERYLAISGGLEVVEECVATDYEYRAGHSGALRLPDRFQPPEKRECDNLHTFYKCGCCHGWVNCKCSCHQPKSDEVEEQIRKLKLYYQGPWEDDLDKKLHSLVRLVEARKK